MPGRDRGMEDGIGWGGLVATAREKREDKRNTTERESLLELLRTAVKYLDHPDVQAIPFAFPASNVARAMHKAIERLES